MNTITPKITEAAREYPAIPLDRFNFADDISQPDYDAIADSAKQEAVIISKKKSRKSKHFQPILMILPFLLLWFAIPLAAQMSASIEVGSAYTDNAFQLSDYDIQRYESGNPDFKFMNASDDVILNAKVNAAYKMQWHWWYIQPSLQANAAMYMLNPEKQKFDSTIGLKISRRIGELGFHYGYYPEVYLRDYKDTDGTNQLQAFEYAKNQYRADIMFHPLRKSDVTIEFKRDDYFYNEYFTEFDGTSDTWKLDWQQSLPTFYLNAAYAYKVYETDSSAEINNSEDASYESNIYSFGLLMKKMPLDAAYPEVFWRPELKLGYEQRYFQGSDSWHNGRTDIINNTDASLQFYFGPKWNINLDYSHVFRNVDAMNSSVQKYKEYNENRYGISARYQF